MRLFPQPVTLAGGTTRWKLSTILQFEAARAGAPAPRIDPATDQWLSARAVAARLGVAPGTVWRWTAESRSSRSEAA